jgi:plasmid replication initiation protein
VLVKPYNNREALNNALNNLFNQRLSAIRTIHERERVRHMDVEAPILRMMRAHFHAARVIIITTAILHNIGIRMEAEVVDNDEVLNFL